MKPSLTVPPPAGNETRMFVRFAFVVEKILLRNGRFDGMRPADLAAMLDRQHASGCRLVLHFHGGLVNRAAGIAIAERLAPLYEQAGGYPLFFVWQSGLGETIVTRLQAISGETIYRRLLARVLQFTVGKIHTTDTGKRSVTVQLPDLEGVYTNAFDSPEPEPYDALTAVPDTEDLTNAQEQQFTALLRADPIVQREAVSIAAALARPDEQQHDRGTTSVGTPAVTLMSPEILEEIRAEASSPGERSVIATTRLVKGAIFTVRRVLRRLHGQRGHGLYTTVVEELLREFYITNAGRPLWQQMKRDTSDSFGRDHTQCGGSALLHELATRPTIQAPVLVGHSTGSHYICNLLAHADATLPAETTFDVVLLAPACDFALMDATFTRHAGRIARLRMFSMTDQHERNDRLLPGVYPRSLLYFVSGLLEAEADWPLLGMQRFHTDAPPFTPTDFPTIEHVRQALALKPYSTVWSVATGTPGLASAAVHHGDFDDEASTLDSVGRFIQGI